MSFANTSTVNSSTDSKVVIITTGEYAPWTSEAVNQSGYVNHIIKEAFAKEGYDVVFKYYPWKRAYNMAKTGEVDATSFWFADKKHKNDFLASATVMTERTVFFHIKTTDFRWEKLEDLKELQIGATLGYTYTKEFWDLKEKKKLHIQAVPDDITNFKKLFNDRIDLFPIGMVAGYEILNKEFKSSFSNLITCNAKPLTKTTGHLLFPKKNLQRSQHLLKIFNQGLQKLEQEGKVDQYFDSLLRGGYSK
jgi:polar amino acid transport system substrate-binding protein